MAQDSSVIIINGKRYDATSGRMVGAKKNPATSIDGVHKLPSPIDRTKQQKAAVPVKKSKRIGLREKHPSQSIHHRQESSKTLMRRIVSRPAKTTDRPEAKSGSGLKKYLRSPNHIRVARAKTVSRSPKVKHFGMAAASHLDRKRPDRPNDKKPTTKARASENPKSAMTPPPPSMITSVSHRQLEKMLDEALFKADAHKQTLNKHLRRGRQRWLPRWLSVSLIVLLVLAVAGFFAWQNIPQISMRFAASRAHVGAGLPSYIPPGFNFKAPIKYDEGSVTINFQAAGGNSRSFSLNQRVSNLDSASLAGSLPKNTEVRTSELKATTIYIYASQNNATWVNGGIRYTIEDHAQLDSDQLLKIADSL